MMIIKRVTTILAVALGLSHGNAATIRGAAPEKSAETRNLEAYVWPPSFLDAYKEAFPNKQFLRCSAFLEDKGITDPTTGTKCHKRVNMGPYSCFSGEQTCESDIVDSTVHPAKICDCDIETGLLTCDESWDPCKASELLLDVQPQTYGMDFAPLDAELTPPPFGTELDARPTFEGTWDGSLDLDIAVGDRGTEAPDDTGIVNDVNTDGDTLLLPPGTQTERTNFPEWEGGKCVDAAAAISEELNVWEVECIELGSLISFDWNPHRVRIYYMPNSPDKTVVGIPMLG